MRWVFGGGVHDDSLMYELRQAGEDVHDGPGWYHFFQDGVSQPSDWGLAFTKYLEENGPFDCFVVVKGGLFRNGHFWHIDDMSLWSIRRHVRCMIYLCYDDPAFTPIALGERYTRIFDAYGTTCPGIWDLFQPYRSRMTPRLFRHWLAWDRRISYPILFPEANRCDVAFTGTPYYRPFPPPHYQGGFSGPRRDLVWAAIKSGANVGIWGTRQWMDPDQGGDPALEPYYRGWVPIDQIHTVHAAAKVCVATHLVEGNLYESGRIPWVGGAGSALLHEERPGLRNEFGDLIEWYRPGDVADFTAKLSLLLGNDEYRLRIATALRERVLEQHTWKNRIDDLLKIAHSVVKS